MNEKALKQLYKDEHDTLSEIYYDGTMGMSKEEFDDQHGLIWATLERELIKAGYANPPRPLRDLTKEFDDLKIKLKLNGVID